MNINELNGHNENENEINLKDPKVRTALEQTVFHRVKGLPADKWLACLGLLLIANQGDPDADEIEIDINGIRMCVSLLPPTKDSPMRDRSNDKDGEEGLN